MENSANHYRNMFVLVIQINNKILKLKVKNIKN